MEIYKFDGNATASVKGMQHVAKLIQDNTSKIVVLSAPKDVTKHLGEVAANFFNRNIEEAHDKITRLEFQFIDFANELLTDDTIKHEAIRGILDCFQAIWKYSMEPFYATDEKEILAQGELLTSTLLGFYLQEQGVGNSVICAFDFIRTGMNGEADEEYISRKVKEICKAYPDTHLFLTQGSICRNAFGETDCLKQGGSDYTAALIGTAIQAEEIRIWTDVDIHSNDTLVVKDADTIKNLSFSEAERLIYFNPQILHPLCLATAWKENIPIRLLNLVNPASEGTYISANRLNGNMVKAVATKDSITYIRFESNHTLRPYMFISKIFDIFAKYKTMPCLLTSSNDNISVATDDGNFLSLILRELNKYARIWVEDKMSIISVVGNMKSSCIETEARIMDALKNIPLKMISYGSDENDVSLVVKATDKVEALRLLDEKLLKKEWFKKAS
ncbi:amino acid kinase family protein [Bacteroides timonensis]|uniref:amino acid kinase family protein n=1 Tax=Bacteroides timonensis TaxID=1470345 RepID=UPI0004AD1619|nr:aspartate kinase [Bacteroides timonensis]